MLTFGGLSSGSFSVVREVERPALPRSNRRHHFSLAQRILETLRCSTLFSSDDILSKRLATPRELNRLPRANLPGMLGVSVSDSSHRPCGHAVICDPLVWLAASARCCQASVSQLNPISGRRKDHIDSS